MRRKVLITGLALIVVLILSAIYFAKLTENKAVNIASGTRSYKGDEPFGGSAYDVNFTLSKTPVGTLNMYLPRYSFTDNETAEIYAEMFGMVNLDEDNEDAYIYSNSEGALFIYKDISLIKYIANEPINNYFHKILIDEEEAVRTAASFFEDKFLFLNYEEAQVIYADDCYEISFINRLGNIKNHAFYNYILLDNNGAVLEAEYYYLKYNRLDSTVIKSMREAFYELPQDLPDTVDLQGCQLVYIFENSIIQPAYLFKGELTGGRSFQCFVKASVYQ